VANALAYFNIHLISPKEDIHNFKVKTLAILTMVDPIKNFKIYFFWQKNLTRFQSCETFFASSLKKLERLSLFSF